MTDSIDRFRDWDAAYVLGALSPDDRRAYERHLATCPDCTEALAELAGLPGMLGKLSAEDAVAILESPDVHSFDAQLLDREHKPGLVQSLAAAAHRRRRRSRLGMLVAVAAIVAVVGVGGVTLALNQGPTSSPVAMAPLHQKVITASLQITKKGWGTSFAWSCDYHGDAWEGTRVSYDLVVQKKSGGETTVATWTTAGPRAAGLTASSAIATSDIRSVEIRLTGTTAPLLRENL